jgi:CHAD domain-containing protein/phosphohistidine phosphatase SixA
MPAKPAIESLCVKYRNEDVHSQFVARLALQIFDAVSPHLRLPLSLRPLVRAAALLHDVGYCENPADHQAAGSMLVAKQEIAGFAREQIRIVAAAILLHRKDYGKAYGTGLFDTVDDKETTLWIGAILRVADGLDHGHLQNAEILSVKQQAGGFLLSVASPGYRNNIGWAQAKADLWKRVFHKELRIADAGSPYPATRFAGIVKRGNGVVDAARRLLFLNYRILSENYQGVLAAESEEPLHDFRVAMRRFRAALRLFGPFLPKPAVRSIDRRLASLALALSPIRDNDVWLQFLASKRVLDAFRGNIDFVHFHALQSRRQKADRRVLRKLLTNPEYGSLMRDINRFLRVDLPQKIKKPQYPVEPLAARRLFAIYFEILSRPGVKKGYDVQEMHRRRKLCRRARYWAEFSEPLLGQPASLLARRFKALADILGDLHDSDMAVERIETEHSPTTGVLKRHALANKRRLLARLNRAGRSIRSPSILYAVTAISHEAQNNTAYCYLVRHANAQKAGGDRRTLDKQGIFEARTAGRALALLQCKPDVIAASPLPRACDTAALLAQSFAFNAPLTRKNCLAPDADVEGTVAWLSGVSAHSCLCVGHMPHLERLAGALLRPGESGPIEFTKASACCISFETGIEGGKGTLEWYFSEKKLKRIVNRITGKR